jgi:branched-chain amino acid transport system substrate-binding protein
MIRKLILALVCASLVLLPAVSRAADPYDFHVILSLSGYAAFIGQQEQTGLRALEEAVNKTGGINGQPVRFDIVDDQSNPANAVQLANQIIAKGVPVILGPTLTSDCEAVFPAILEKGPVTFCFSPALYPKAGSYGFSSGPSTRDLNLAALRYFRERGWHRIGVLVTTDASGQDGERQVTYDAGLPENRSIHIVDLERFNVTDVSIAPQIEKLKAAKPDAIVAWVTGTPTGTALLGLHNAGLDVPTMLNAGDIVQKQIAQYSAFAPKTLLFPGFLFMAPEMTQDAAVKREQQQFLAALKAQGSPPVLSAALAYDPARIVIDALRHLGTKATATQLKDYVEHIKGMPGIDGRIDYADGSQHGIGVSGCVILRWDQGRKDFVPVSKPGGYPG